MSASSFLDGIEKSSRPWGASTGPRKKGRRSALSFNRDCRHAGRDCRRQVDARHRADPKVAGHCCRAAARCHPGDCRRGARLADAADAVAGRTGCRHRDWRGRKESLARCRDARKASARVAVHRPGLGHRDAGPSGRDRVDRASHCRSCLHCAPHTDGCRLGPDDLHLRGGDLPASCRKAWADQRCGGRWGRYRRHQARTSCGTQQGCHRAAVWVPWWGGT